jgi:cytoskeletal protein RodZ
LSRNVGASNPSSPFNEHTARFQHDRATSDPEPKVHRPRRPFNRFKEFVMSPSICHRVPVAVWTAAVALWALQGMTLAEAQARDRSSTVTGAQGQSATRAVSRSQGQVSSSTTGPKGKTSSRVLSRTAEGSTATLTGPNGKTATRTSTRSADGGSTTVTGPQGGVSMRSTERTETGSTTTVTGPQGRTGTIAVTRKP